MPIVAGIGGNSGNQTITMIVRGIALRAMGPDDARPPAEKETGVALINLIFGRPASASWPGCQGGSAGSVP